MEETIKKMLSGKKDKVVCIRLTKQFYELVESRARENGFKSVSKFVEYALALAVKD